MLSLYSIEKIQIFSKIGNASFMHVNFVFVMDAFRKNIKHIKIYPIKEAS